MRIVAQIIFFSPLPRNAKNATNAKNAKNAKNHKNPKNAKNAKNAKSAKIAKDSDKKINTMFRVFLLLQFVYYYLYLNVQYSILERLYINISNCTIETCLLLELLYQYILLW